MSKVHPTAVVEQGAQLAEDVSVGPFCHVGPRVSIGADTRLLSHVAIHGRTTLGQGNVVWPFTTLGGDPQDLKFTGEDSVLVIGDHNEIRESVTVHKGTNNDEGATRIGDHNLIMVGCHIGHDCIVDSHVIMANNVLLAGHVHIQDHASIGGGAALHHFVTVGEHAYIGGLSRIVSDVPPYILIEGNPARVRKVNTIGLRRRGFPQDQIDQLSDAFRRLYRRVENNQTPGRTTDAMVELETEFAQSKCILALTDALRRSSQGIHGRYREALRLDNTFTNPVR